MKKTTTIKISLFAFISAIICFISNYILYLDVLSYVTQGFTFLAYLFFMIWICQAVYGKTRLKNNWTVLIMSFSLAIYSFVQSSLTTSEILLEYYVLFFYLLVLLCLVSSIVLVGRMIFSSPKEKHDNNDSNNNEEPIKATPSVTSSTWTCSCGAQNTGKFCSECGEKNITEENIEITK